MSPQPEPEVDDAIGALGAIEGAANVLIADPRFQAVGRWIAAYVGGEAPGDLYAFVSGAETTRGPSARLTATITRRDSLIVEAVELAFAGLPIAQQAALMSAALRSYAAIGWPRDRLRTAGNPHDRATLKGLLYEVLRLRDRPLSPASVGRIIRCHRLQRDLE